MYEGDQVIQNLVIEVRPQGDGRRRVTVPHGGVKGGGLPHPTSHYQPNNDQNHHHHQSTITTTTTSTTKSKDGSTTITTNSSKKNNNSSRHSYHSQQQAANGGGATGKGSANSGAARSASVHHAGHNDGGAGAASNNQHQHQHSNKGATVQRQRSCVANLYGSHGRSQCPAMPAATVYQRPKPAMQLYRPPTLRVSDDNTMPNGIYAYDVGNAIHDSFKPGLNINAKEFVSLSSNGSIGYVTQSTSSGSNAVSFSGPNGLTTSALKHSKSSSQVILRQSHHVNNTMVSYNGITGLHHSKSGGYLGGKVLLKDGRVVTGGVPGVVTSSGFSPPLRVHFTDDTIAYDPDNKVGMIQRSPTGGTQLLPLPIKRSKSLGSAADLASHHGSGGLLTPSAGAGDTSVATANATNAIADMSPFADDVAAKLQQLVTSTNGASARLVMEVVRHLFNKLVQATRYAEPAARYCIAIIEKESGGETFLETLLNTCQEYYQERDRLLRATGKQPGAATPHPHTKWVSYMTFLHEMYTQVKRRQRTVVSSTGPGLLLLTLLGEACVVSLEDQAAGGAAMAQTECLFFILTGVGKDLEIELPSLMSKVMAAARDALFASVRMPAVRKTLLQLIEMSAANWQLPAPAVMYYYPAVGAK